MGGRANFKVGEGGVVFVFVWEMRLIWGYVGVKLVRNFY